MAAGGNLVLVGFMGTGKTEVGRILSNLLDLPFVDIDDDITSMTGMTINQIFNKHGEEYFRALESEVISRYAGENGLVIATGGGSLLRRENVVNLKKNGFLICLAASPKEIQRRVKDKRHRPLLNVESPLGIIQKLLSGRSESYKLADVEINTEGKTPAAVAHEVILVCAQVGITWK